MRTKRYILFILFVLLFGVYHAQKLNLLGDTTAICAGDSFLIKFPEDLVSKSATYQWATPYKIIDHAKQLYVKQKGRYMVKIYDGNKVIIDTTYVKINEKPKITIPDTIVCNGSLLIINPKTKYKYSWSTGESSETLKIDKPGKYWIKTNNKGCFYTDTFRVSSAVGTVPNFGKELLVCENDANKLLSVRAPADVKLYWNTGANTLSINATREGYYWVKSVSKTCGSKTDSVYVKYKNCDCDIYIPNSFTPNDDDRNDLFAPVFQCEYNYFLITIFDRWGNTVYTSTNINGKWDGRFKNNPCPDDVYVYRIEAIQKSTEKKIIKNGHISLFR